MFIGPPNRIPQSQFSLVATFSANLSQILFNLAFSMAHKKIRIKMSILRCRAFGEIEGELLVKGIQLILRDVYMFTSMAKLGQRLVRLGKAN